MRLLRRIAAAFALAALLVTTGWSRELTNAEHALKQQLGPETPDPIPLWPGKPPRFVENAPEEIAENAKIRSVSVPTITPYLPPREKGSGMAVIVCAGGGYGSLDWKTHVVYAAQVFNPKGVAVIGLKYRLRPPNGKSNDDIEAITLLDAKRAVRMVRARATEWGLDAHRIGIVGYSAGANLAMNLAANFDAGDPQSSDPIERLSSRPDFAVGCATWHWRQKESPFRFSKHAPPVFLVHATNDGVPNKDGRIGGAPMELPRAIERDLRSLGVPVKLAVFNEGAHGVGNLIPQRVKHEFPPAKWPDLLIDWLNEISRR